MAPTDARQTTELSVGCRARDRQNAAGSSLAERPDRRRWTGGEAGIRIL